MTGSQAIEQCYPYWVLSENWGKPDMVDTELIFLTCEYRVALDKSLHISPVEGAVYAKEGHSEKSWHKIIKDRNSLAMAMDVFPNCDIAYAWLTALRFPFGGIGVYPFYKYPAKRIQGMLHLDIRPTHKKILWWRDEDGLYKYLKDAQDIKNLFKVISHE